MVKIVIATHKKFNMPSDELYLPLQVGASLNDAVDLGYVKDNVGENISYKNTSFGTQTGLYWAWKNLDYEFIGLVHYRRYFVLKNLYKKPPFVDSLKLVLSEKQLEPLLEKYRIIVPNKRQYIIETVYSHYAKTIYDGEHQLEILRSIINEFHHSFLDTYDAFMKQHSAYIFNMMIMEKKLMNDYCRWLFSILFELEKLIDTNNYSDFGKRYIGRISERLLNVWLIQQVKEGKLDHKSILELPYIEDVNTINKIIAFAKAKFTGEKYSASF